MQKVMTFLAAALIAVSGVHAQESREVRPRMPGDRGPGSSDQEKASRSAAIADLEPCDVLGVFAHPDDETFASGTFALLSAKGQRVQLVYATSGDAGGDKSGRGLSGTALGEEREQEMRNAAEALELSTEPLFLRYPDGQVYDHWDEVVGSVREIIAKTRPKVVITFGPDGLYGHADHVAVGQITGRAFDDSGVPSHLLHMALSRTRNDLVVKAGGGDRYKAVADRFITYRVNVEEQLENRVGAMGSHVTQFAPQEVMQYKMLAIATRVEDFVEARHPGESGSISELLSE